MTTNSASQLHLLADVSRSLATFTDLDELVHFATQRTCELFEAEGCALLLLDATRREFRFPVASQRPSGASAAALAEIRFPADRGIAGWVLSHDESALVPDTATDARFYDAVDRQTAMRTRSLLCSPLRTRRGNIGVLEVVNPGAGHLEPADLEFLDILASEIGVAYEKAALYHALEREVLDLRGFCRSAGVALSALGVVLAAAATLYHRARVLPWEELPTRRGVLIGALCLVIGVTLIGVGRGWLVARRAASNAR
ncbi:GAF domain-containing protein [bacterium]|nr:GAF domain-containing protein [bacterium]